MLKHRLLLGPAMIVVLLGVFYLDNMLDQVDLTGTVWQSIFLGRTYLPAGLLMLVCILVVIVLAGRELCGMFHAKQVEAGPFMVGLSGCLGCILLYSIPYGMDAQKTMAIYASCMAGIFILTIVAHAWGGKTHGAVTVAAVTVFALIYLGTMPGFLLAIRRRHSAWVVAAVILLAKSCDIGAYFTGRALGRRKLISWLSPGKTWEGLAGGLIVSAGIAVGLAAVSNHYHWSGRWGQGQAGRQFVHYHLPLWYAALSGVLIGFVGQVGDLTASLFKRDAGLKDSGQSIPGFGGVLDVIDSPLLVAPIAYWLLIFVPLLGGGG